MIIILAQLCLGSSLVGNPKVKLVEWEEGEVVSAELPSPVWKFVSSTGQVQTVPGPACDLAVGCSVQAPFAIWTEVSVKIPDGLLIETEEDEFEISADNFVHWTNPGAPVSRQGPPADAGLIGMTMAVSQ